MKQVEIKHPSATTSMMAIIPTSFAEVGKGIDIYTAFGWSMSWKVLQVSELVPVDRNKQKTMDSITFGEGKVRFASVNNRLGRSSVL